MQSQRRANSQNVKEELQRGELTTSIKRERDEGSEENTQGSRGKKSKQVVIELD